MGLATWMDSTAILLHCCWLLRGRILLQAKALAIESVGRVLELGATLLCVNSARSAVLGMVAWDREPFVLLDLVMVLVVSQWSDALDLRSEQHMERFSWPAY